MILSSQVSLRLRECQNIPLRQATAVYSDHPAVLSRRPFKTLGDLETKIKKAENREQKAKEAEEKRKGEIQVSELWKPFNTTVPFFVAAEKE